MQDDCVTQPTGNSVPDLGLACENTAQPSADTVTSTDLYPPCSFSPRLNELQGTVISGLEAPQAQGQGPWAVPDVLKR